MDLHRRRLRFSACALGLVSASIAFSRAPGHHARVPAKVVSHTQMQVVQPWSAAFEESWQVPSNALSGSLLRKDGQYVAAIEWASQADCDAWLEQPGMEQTRALTAQYVVCGMSDDAPAVTTTSAPQQKAFARELMDKAFEGGVRSRADLDALNRAPEVDPSVLFAISAGEDVDIDESDEVLISGGDPMFLSDEQWSRRVPNVPTNSAKSKIPSQAMNEHDEENDEEDVLFHGGDPTFLDDTVWASSAGKKHEDEEWDGVEDDTAHLFD